MNSSPSTPNLESLRQAIQNFTPNPRRVPFNNLKPLHDAIVELRGKNASYAIIAELLIQNGVKTSVARVAEYGRIILDGGKSRKRRKRAKKSADDKCTSDASKCASLALKTRPSLDSVSGRASATTNRK